MWRSHLWIQVNHPSTSLYFESPSLQTVKVLLIVLNVLILFLPLQALIEWGVVFLVSHQVHSQLLSSFLYVQALIYMVYHTVPFNLQNASEINTRDIHFLFSGDRTEAQGGIKSLFFPLPPATSFSRSVMKPLISGNLHARAIIHFPVHHFSKKVKLKVCFYPQNI